MINYELDSAIEATLPLSNITIKDYLFYLIDYELVSCNGQKQIFSIEYEGFGLLNMINEEKRQEKIDIDNITTPLNMMQIIKTIYNKN